MAQDQPPSFSGVDYAVFCGLLLISTVIGIFYAWKDRNEKNADAYLVANRQMSPIPVAISLCVSYVSGVMMIGIPTQVYYYGIILCWYSIVYMVGPWITGLYFIPLFFRLNIMSVYEILEMRFGKYSRLCAATSVLILMFIYMGIVTYVPCLSLSAVSPVSIPLSITLTCLVCTFYTTLGGIKAVIWTDVIQAMVMVFGMISVIVTTTSHVGGFSNVTAALIRGNRTNFVDLSTDMRIRNSTWTLVIGAPVTWTMMSAVNQQMVQRYLSCRNVKQARIAVWIFLIPQQLFFWLAIITGITMYAYYETCDPLFSGYIRLPDQALPYMVVELFANTPGLAGIFVAAVYSGTLSTISSGINSLAAVILSDYLLKFKPSLKKKSLKISKLLVCLLGFVVLGMTFMVKAMGKLVVDIFITTFGSIGGPLMAVYTMAIFMPWINEKGAVSGQIIGTFLGFWISVGQVLYPPPVEFLKIKPLSISGCSTPAPSDFNTTLTETTICIESNFTTESDFFSGESPTTAAAVAASQEVPYRPPLADSLYALSSNYIGLLGFLSCLVVGIVVSGITGFENPQYANTEIFTPLVDNRFLPEKVIKFFRMGVPLRQKVRSEDSASSDSNSLCDGKETVV